MKIKIKGYPPIIIPSELAQPESGAFDGHTPYVAKLSSRLRKPAYRMKTLPSKLLCLQVLKDRMEGLGDYKSFLEPLAGVGLSARIFDKGKTVLNDTDESCRRILDLNFGGKATGEDVLKMPFPKLDVIFLDFNDFTLKRSRTTVYGDVLFRAFDAAKKFVILNDCSVFYFRYGKTSFKAYEKYVGRVIGSIEDYFQALQPLYQNATGGDWNLVHVAYFRDTSFQLFSRTRAKFKLDKIENPKAIVEASGLC